MEEVKVQVCTEVDKKERKLEFHEVEVKFRIEESKLNDWKQLVENLDGVKSFLYVESDDVYYVKGNEFLRYRSSDNKRDKRAELTYKKKTTEGNNIIRKEINLRVDPNNPETVEAFTNCLGYKKNFTIRKYVSIYFFEDATLPWYTVIDEKGKRDTFCEIEVNEEKIPDLTEEQCWEIIRKYEAILAPLGVSNKNRLRLSLFEMYKVKDEKSKVKSKSTS